MESVLDSLSSDREGWRRRTRTPTIVEPGGIIEEWIEDRSV
jgi:hypothetical protein